MLSYPTRIACRDPEANAADEYLSQYLMLYRMLRAEEADAERAEHAWEGITEADASAFCETVSEIRRLVLSVKAPRERLFLFQYYICGKTVEQCAELLGLSVRSVFRLKKRALDTVGKKLSVA